MEEVPVAASRGGQKRRPPDLRVDQEQRRPSSTASCAWGRTRVRIWIRRAAPDSSCVIAQADDDRDQHRAGIRTGSSATSALVEQLAAGQELPGAGDVQHVDVLVGLRQRRVGLGELGDAQRGGVEQLDAAGLDRRRRAPPMPSRRIATLITSVPARFAAPGLVGIVEVADALDPVDPGAQVAGPGVFAWCWRRRTCASGAWRSAPSAGGSRPPAAPSPGRGRSSPGPAAAALSSACGRASGVGIACSARGAADHARLAAAAAARATARAAAAAPRRIRPAAPTPAWASRGRLVLSCSPPPWLLAWARKSACFGVSAVWVWVRITSSVGSTGAASSSAKPTPRISMPCSSSDSTSVALEALAIADARAAAAAARDDGRAHRAAQRGLDARRTAGRRC